MFLHGNSVTKFESHEDVESGSHEGPRPIGESREADELESEGKLPPMGVAFCCIITVGFVVITFLAGFGVIKFKLQTTA